jgi:uncharacterized protein YfaQ (DUF2300 family)
MRFFKFASPPAIAAGLFALLASSGALAQDYTCTPSNFSVWTAQYNGQRTGANTSETCLTPTNVGGGTMAQQLQLLTPSEPNSCSPSSPTAAACCSASYTGGSGYSPVYAQPLYIYGATVTGAPGGTANIVVVATLLDQVYAFDATAQQTTTNPCKRVGALGKVVLG